MLGAAVSSDVFHVIDGPEGNLLNILGSPGHPCRVKVEGQSQASKLLEQRVSSASQRYIWYHMIP